MKHKIISNFSKLNHNHIRLFWLILSLALFVIGAGAPGAESGIGN